MAQKRMFDKNVVESDKFLDLPNSSKALYFMAGMEADDKGFFQPRKLQRMCGFSDDDYKILIAKGFFITFESGVMVVTDWNKNNWLDSRRVTETEYVDELKMLKLINNKYELANPTDSKCLAGAKPSLREYSIVEYSIEENSIVECSSNKRENEIKKIIDFYNNNIGQLTPYAMTILESYMDQIETDCIILAMQKAVESNKRNMQYIKGILNNWTKAGIKTLVEAKDEEIAFKNKKVSKEETLEEQVARYKKEWGLTDED